MGNEPVEARRRRKGSGPAGRAEAPRRDTGATGRRAVLRTVELAGLGIRRLIRPHAVGGGCVGRSDWSYY